MANTSTLSPSGAHVVALADVRVQKAAEAVRHLKQAIELVAEWGAHCQVTSDAAKQATAAALGSHLREDYGPASEWTTALDNRAQRAKLKTGKATVGRLKAVRRMIQCRLEAGAALSHLSRPEARKVYAGAFGGLTVQVQGQRVATLVRDYQRHRALTARAA